jgi:hypothetical protein
MTDQEVVWSENNGRLIFFSISAKSSRDYLAVLSLFCKISLRNFCFIVVPFCPPYPFFDARTLPTLAPKFFLDSNWTPADEFDVVYFRSLGTV